MTELLREVAQQGAFLIKDSGGPRQEFSGGMVRDTAEEKANFLNVLFGPMLWRLAEHLTKGRNKYPDPQPGVPNWTLAEGEAEYLRAKESALRHLFQWLVGERDEDHAAAVIFNINVAEYVLDKASNHGQEIDPGLGATSPSLYATPDASVSIDDFIPLIRPTPERPLDVGDVVRVTAMSWEGNTGRIVSTAVGNSLWMFNVLIDGHEDWGPLGFSSSELELIQECNSNCLDCVCP